MKILLGPAGSPAKSTIDGLKFVSDMGLQAMEVAFTHGVKMGIATAKSIAEENKKYNISLSIHAPYYINLTSTDRIKIKESKKRILDTCERGHHMGASKVVFHVAYYGKSTKDQTYEGVKTEIGDLLDRIKENNWNVKILPETAGRISQFGDLKEIINLASETGCGICIDPAHLYARNNGVLDFTEMFDKLEATGSKEFHFHFSGINYGPRGERNHLILSSNKPNFSDFAKELIRRELSATIISESPITWQDSISMRKIIEKLGYKFG